MSDSIFSSVLSEERWAIHMNNTFPIEHIVDIDYDRPPCVYRVSKSLKETKPEAYCPQQIGLGPYHHLRPDLYKMQRHKLSVMRKFLSPEQLKKFQFIVKLLMGYEPLIRACYDQYVDLDIVTLSWILAIDVIYLLHFLSTYKASLQFDDHAHDFDVKELSKDVIMLENQIPVDLLMIIKKALELKPLDDNEGKDFSVFNDLNAFCEAESPLEISKQWTITSIVAQTHLLHRLYYLIVNNRGIKNEIFPMSRILEESYPIKLKENLTEGLGAAKDILPEPLQKHITFMEKVPWQRILAVFMKKDPDEENPLVEEINVPSVSQLVDLAGVEFELTKGGIRDIKFDEETKKFYLPGITMRPNTEVILRNLVEFEAAISKKGSNLEFAEYVDLICGIVDTPKDVDILRKAEIVKGDMPDEEIAKILNGIRKSTGKKEKPSNVEEAIEKVNKRYDDIFKVRMYRCIKRHVYRSWKFLTVISTVLVLVLLCIQAFCSVYGCSRRWFGSTD